MTISQELLDLLVCPTCKTELTLAKDTLTCKKCHSTYEIKDGVPVLFPKN